MVLVVLAVFAIVVAALAVVLAVVVLDANASLDAVLLMWFLLFLLYLL